MDGFTSLQIHRRNVFFKPTSFSVDKQICEIDNNVNEIDKNVKNLIKNIDGLNNPSCCRMCCGDTFREIVDSSLLADQKIQAIQKRALSKKQKMFADHLDQKLSQQFASISRLLDRKLGLLPPVCFQGFVRESVIKRQHSWTQILPCAAILGIGAVVSRPFRLGIMVGVADYFFVVAAKFFNLKYSLSAVDAKCNKQREYSRIRILTTIVAVSVGFAISQPAFNAGIPAGLIYSSFALTALSFCLKYLHPSPSFYDSNFFIKSILGPLHEEVMFRGVLQKLVCNVTGSSLAGSVISAGAFGAAHLTNGHEAVAFQSIQAGFSGLVYGAMNYHLGLAAPFAAHAMKNFLACK